LQSFLVDPRFVSESSRRFLAATLGFIACHLGVGSIAASVADVKFAAMIAEMVFQFPEADTDALHMWFYPIGALSPKQSKQSCRDWNAI
jgi:hypothetical protein